MQNRSIGRVVFWLMASVVAGGAACGDDDGESGGGGESGTVCDRGNAVLRRCGLIDEPVACLPAAQEPNGECTVACLEAIECATLKATFCSAVQPPTEDAQDLVDCLGRCWDANGFHCASGGASVDPSYQCDGEADCFDGSDEADCPMFACGDGTSVVQAYACDGFPDCVDGADEEGCERHTCDDGTTVPASFRCDSEPDCADGSDESDCEGTLRVQCDATN